jgi:FkbM family methyltransferase
LGLTTSLRQDEARLRACIARAQRRRFFRRAGRFAPYVAAETGNGVFLVDTSDSGLAPKLFEKCGRGDFRTLDVALHLLRSEGILPSGTFIDVGANIGTTTVAALNHGFDHAVAVEPAARTYFLLTANLALNDLGEAVRSFRLAISDDADMAPLQIRSSSKKAQLVVKGGRSRWPTELVATTTLDALLTSSGIDSACVGMLWLDVEGHEGHVLDGACSLLTLSPPLVMELHPRRLDRKDGLERVQRLLPRHYTHIADLGLRDAARFAPIDELMAIAERFRKGGQTDVLAVKLG